MIIKQENIDQLRQEWYVYRYDKDRKIKLRGSDMEEISKRIQWLTFYLLITHFVVFLFNQDYIIVLVEIGENDV